ncbi:MAG: hypothetical protein JO328_17060 [Hyphomicrobiales bacterium]|nr:hypothetical protein [Hyphomicrobiales bacterium]MBV8827037.1 hypothetical protein [Hyphomicrobiales bacterium]
MADDRDLTDEGGEASDSVDFSNSDPVLTFTRRDVLIGGASSLIASQAPAAQQPAPYLDVAYEDGTRQGLVIAWVEPAPAAKRTGIAPQDKRYEWRLRAATFTEPNLPNGNGRFVLRRTQGGWRADIARCVFPGGYLFGLMIDLTWDPSLENKPPTLTFTILRPDKNISLRVDDLRAFLMVGNSKAAGAVNEIAGPINKAQVSALTQRLFGETFESAKANDVQLVFHHGGYWILRAGHQTKDGTETPAQKQNRFAALSAEGISIRFKEVFFTVFSGGTGGNEAAVAFQLNPKASDSEQEDVRALFAGDDAPPAPESSKLPANKSTEGSPNRAPVVVAPAAQTQVQRNAAARSATTPTDARAAARVAADTKAFGPRVLYGLVRHGLATPAQAKATPGDVWSGTITLGKGPGGESASITLHDDEGPCFLGWRNASDGNPVFAMRAPMSLAVRRESGAIPSQFEPLSGQLWRARDDDYAVRIVAALTPTQRDMTVDTRFGPFTTAPLPALPPRPGVHARVPPIRVGGTGPRDDRSLNHFAAPLALERAAIGVTSARLSRLMQQNGASADAAKAVEHATIPFSQLTFHEAECLFRINKVPLQHVWSGTPAPSTDPPQAEAIVHIGATKNVALPARLSLSRATLMLRRPADLLALTYRFQDLLLERNDSGWSVTPDRRIAAFVPNGQPKPDPGVPLICLDKAADADDPTRYQPRSDPRPLLVVEFPPQHIAERAFFRQLQADPRLPVPPVGTDPDQAQAETLRNGKPTDRMDVRTAVSKTQNDKLGNDDDSKRFKTFRDKFPAAVDVANGAGAKIPADQRKYIGPAFLDIESARVARALIRQIDSDAATANPPANTADERARLLRGVPEVDLPPAVIAELRAKYAIDDNTVSEDYPAQKGNASVPPESGKIVLWLKERNDRKKQSDYSYRLFAFFYEQNAATRSGIAGLPQDQKDAINAYGDKLPDGAFYGRRSTIARVERLATDATKLAATKAIAATVAAFDVQNENEDKFEIPAEARVSGNSRLVFRIPADDFEGGRPDNRKGAPAGSFPFTIEALTNWGAFDLAVVRRAAKVFEPLAGWRPPSGGQIANGRLPPRWARQETRDEAAKLLHQGITRGDAWSVRHDEQRALDGVSDCPLPLARLGTVAAAQRMAEVVAGVRAPSLYETSIELPFRLMLSPAQDAAWRTPLELPSKLNLTPPADLPVPLWSAQLDEAPGTSSLRAIWSPDFRPDALLDINLGGPPHGPWAPWAMARDVTARNPYLDEEPVYGPPTDCKQHPENCKNPEKFRTGLDVADRHELVALSSLYGLPARGRRKRDGTLADGSQINPPAGFKLRHAALESIDQGNTRDDYSAIYRPQPLGVTELTLTALGGSFDADTNFVPPASAKIRTPEQWGDPNALGQPLFDAFSIERWRQDTRLGRDIRVEVVYKGFLFPLGHRCSLVKLTERRFVAGPGGLAAGPVAFLIQRMFLRIGTPLKTYPSIGQPNGGRSWPPQQLEIMTRVTPDIIDPTDATPGADVEDPSGRIYLRDSGTGMVLPGLVFWPRVRARAGGEVNFELQIDGRGARTHTPLIFVDNTAANDVGTMQALTNWYNALPDPDKPDPRRVLQLGGEKRRYAPEKEPDGTSFETKSWVLGAEGQEAEGQIPRIDSQRIFTFFNTNFDFGALLQGADQPPFYPVCQVATVRVAQVDRMVGRPTGDIDVRFDDEYKAFGFPKDDALSLAPTDAQDRRAKTDVYLDFVKEVSLNPGRNGERTGGPVRPNTPLVAMSRSRGPVGNHRPKRALTGAATPPLSTGLDKPSPDQFFGDAKILGVVDLGSALKFILGGITGTPQFTEATQYASTLLADLQQDADPGAAVAQVRDQLLIPLRDALLTLATEFAQAVKLPPSDDFEEKALQRIERFYPDVGRAYRELRDALNAAINDAAAVRDVDALLNDFAVIYGAGRRFLDAIERVANDPLAAVHEAIRDAFNTTIADVITGAQAVLGDITGSLLDGLKQFEAALRTDLARLFSDPAFAAWRRLVFALPGAHSLANPANATQVDAIVDQVFSQAAQDSGFLPNLTPTNLDQAATAVGTAFDTAFQAAIATTTGQLKADLNAAYNDWKVATGDQGQRVKGVLYDTALPLIAALLVAAANLVKQVGNTPNVGAILGSVQQAAAAAIGTVQSILDYGLAVAHNLCGQMTVPVVTLFNEVTALDATVAKIDTARMTAQTAFANAAAALVPFGLQQAASDIGTLVDQDFQALIDVRNALKHAADNIKTLAADICSATPTHPPLDAFAALRRIRAALLVALNQFVKSLGTADSFNVGGQLQALLAKITGSSGPAAAARQALVQVAAATLSGASVLGELTRDATSLRGVVVGSTDALKDTRAALVTVKTAIPAATGQIDPLITIIDGVAGLARTYKTAIDKAITDMQTLATTTVSSGQEQTYFDQVVQLAASAAGTIDNITNDLVVGVEQKLLNGVGNFLLAGDPYLKQMVLIGLKGLAPLFGFFSQVQTKVVSARDFTWGALGGSAGDTPDPNGIGNDLSAITLEKVRDLLFVAMPPHPRNGLKTPTDPLPDNDYLAAERNEFTDLLATFNSGGFDQDTLKALSELFRDWSQSQGSAQILAVQLGNAASAVLSGDLKRIVDLEGARRRIEEKLKELVPAKIALTYDLHGDLIPVPPFFTPHPGSQITLTAGADYDLLTPTNPPTFTAVCKLDPFDIDLFDVVTLIFSGAQFTSASGKGSDFNISYKDFELGPAAAFLQPLQDLMNPGGSGPYVRPSSDFPGIEAGYSLDLGIISFGEVAFINVSINASCILPFDDRDAIFSVSIGREDRPVLLSILPYLGGGFLALYANAKKMIGFAASFEFGGGGAFQFGPLSGQGRISTGIYLRKFDDGTGDSASQHVLIDGFFYAGGDAHIACFAISATLVVRVSQLADGTMQGSAVFTFSFSMGFAKLRYSVGVQRSIGKGFSGTRSVGLAAANVLLAAAHEHPATVRSFAVAEQEDWLGYLSYFNNIDGFPA